MAREEFLWVEKYRPRKIEDCVLPKEIKRTLEKFVADGELPNLLLAGGPGVGKTTAAKAAIDELGADCIIINGSLNGNIDTLRNDIMQFASAVSFTGGRKYVILDEADYLNAQSTQPALRNFMEEFSRNCGFILTCNFKNRIIEPLHSRCSVVNFAIPKKEGVKLAAEFYKRVQRILAEEGIEYDPEVVQRLIMKHFPDWRKVLNELQFYSAHGKIDVGILSIQSDETFSELIQYLRTKDFTKMRAWVGMNADNDPGSVFRKLYDKASELMAKKSIPQLVLILADYQAKAAWVADQEINLAACLTEIMSSCEFE